MDVEFKPPHQENGTKKEEDSVPKDKAPPEPDTNGTSKESPKHNSRPKRGHRRSRSRTPQQKSDETKTLQVSLKKISAELNGKDLKEVLEKTEEKNDTDKIPEDKNEETVGNEKHTKKQKEDNSKKDESDKKADNNEKEEPLKADESPKKASPKRRDKTKKQEVSQTKTDIDTDTVEMDPLIVSDEPDPELLFDENSDMESGKGSPIISRCMTRRSQTRNIPTPKTPKSLDQDVESEKNSIANTPTEMVDNDSERPKADQLSNTQDSMDTANLSTMVVIGSDATRMEYVENHDSNLTDDNSYINASRDRSLGETLRSLSARRPIRPLDDYRRRALRINQEKSDLNLPYHSMDHITTGLKRKNRSATPEDRKKFKTDTPGLNSLFSSPIANLRNRFRSDLPSSTPKLLGYKDGQNELHYNDEQNMVHTGDDEKKSWCSVM